MSQDTKIAANQLAQKSTAAYNNKSAFLNSLDLAETGEIGSVQSVDDGKSVFKNVADQLTKIFGTKVQVLGITDSAGVPYYEIKFGNKDPEIASQVIDKLVKVRASLGLNQKDIGFTFKEGAPISEENGSIYLYGRDLLNYTPGKNNGGSGTNDLLGLEGDGVWSAKQGLLDNLARKTEEFSQIIAGAKTGMSGSAKTSAEAIALAIYNADSSYLTFVDATGKKQTAQINHDHYENKDGNKNLAEMIFPSTGAYTALMKETDIEEEALKNGQDVLNTLKSLDKNPLDISLFKAIQSKFGRLDAKLVGYAIVAAQDYAQNTGAAMTKFNSVVVDEAYQYFGDKGLGGEVDLNAAFAFTAARPTILNMIYTLMRRDQEINGAGNK